MTNHYANEHAMVRDEAGRFLDDSLTAEHLKGLLEQPGSFDRMTWNSAVELGWSAAAAAEADGGLDLGWQAICVLVEQAGRKTASLPLAGTAAVAQMLLETGQDAAARTIAAALISGEQHACLALAKQGEAGLAFQPNNRIEQGVLHGAVPMTAFGASADVALVPALEGDSFRLLLVPLVQDAVQRQAHPAIDNSRAGADLRFDGARYVEVARDDAGHVALWRTLGLAALAGAFEQIGGATACLEMACAYALERKAFGQQIGRFQAIKGKLADMYIRIELARGCALDALAALERSDEAWHGMAAAARIAAADAYEVSARENIQTHGAIGVTWEAMPHHHYRRARSLAVELGGTVMWRERMLATCGLDLGLAA